MAKKVLIARQPGGQCDEVESEKIKNPRWDDQTGGYKRKMGSRGMYGYIPYSELKNMKIDCSGEHDFGWNDAKVYIYEPNPKKDPNDKKYVEGFAELELQAGPKPISKISENRPKGKPPCTKQILLLLEEGSMTRKCLRDCILCMGYESFTFRNAIWGMKRDGRILCNGSPNSPKQLISRNEQKVGK